MTIEQIRAARTAAPFKPFTIHTADGRSFHVSHPDFLSHHPAGRTLIVYGSGDSFSILDLLLVTELEFSDTSASSDGAAA